MAENAGVDHPEDRWWHGWDFFAVAWVVVGVVVLSQIPSALQADPDARTMLLIILSCGGLTLVLAGFGRRLRRVSARHEHPRPYDAPD